MLKQEQTLLNDAMSVAGITKLPTKVEPDDMSWIEGVAKIKLSDGSTVYGIVKRNADLSYTATYVNGAIASILSVEEVYPYERIDKAMVRKFSSKDDVDSRVKYLKSLNLPYDIDFENASIATLNKEIVKAALYKYLSENK